MKQSRIQKSKNFFIQNRPNYGSRDPYPHFSRMAVPSSSKDSQSVELVTNAYSLMSYSTQTNIYEYQLTVTTSSGCKDMSAKVLIRSYVSRSIRKFLMERILPELLDPGFDGSAIIGSNLDTIYTLKPLIDHASKSLKVVKSEEFSFENLPVKTDLLNNLYVDIAIKYSRHISLDCPDQRLALMKSVLHHQLMFDMLRYGSVYYESHNEVKDAMQTNRLDLISQYIMGISLSGLRLSADHKTLVVINCPYAYITGSYQLIDLLATFITGRPTENVTEMQEIKSINGTEDWLKVFHSILEGFKCRTGAGDNCRNLRYSFSDKPAASLLFEDNTHQPITVQDYYNNLGTPLIYPNLPCLKSQSTEHPYYPLEVCSLLPDQKVPMFRLSTAARNLLTSLNKSSPEHSKKSSQTARDKVESKGKVQFEKFGLGVSKTPVEAKGFVLDKPRLLFQNLEFEPVRDTWESGIFHQAMHLMNNWCVVNTVDIDFHREDMFFAEFSRYSKRFGFDLGRPNYINRSKQDILNTHDSINHIVEECQRLTEGSLKFILFVIDSTSTSLNRLIHLSFDDTNVTSTCLRVESIMNQRQQRSIYRTLIHKLNTRLGGTNLIYHDNTLARLCLRDDDLMIVGLDVTHPDNELSGVSIVGCAYTYSHDLFRHKSLVWPQGARVEIIGKMDTLMKHLLHDYYLMNKGNLPKQIVFYRDGVSHEEFEKVRISEVMKAQLVLDETAQEIKQSCPKLSYIIAQKRHTMRFFQPIRGNTFSNPPSGTLIDKDIVTDGSREFFLYSSTSHQATARPLHYHVLQNGMGIENIQKLTYFLCFNFGKCSGTLSMPSSLRYAHNAAYDARNRVIADREFSENRFYPCKFFC